MFVVLFLVICVSLYCDETYMYTEFDCDAVQYCSELRDVCNGNFDAKQYIMDCVPHDEIAKTACLNIKKDPRCLYGYRKKYPPHIIDFPLKESLHDLGRARVNYIAVHNDKCPVDYFITQICDEDPQYMNFDYEPLFTSPSGWESGNGDLVLNVNTTIMCIIRKSRCEMSNNFHMVMYQITDRESYKDHLTMLEHWEKN